MGSGVLITGNHVLWLAKVGLKMARQFALADRKITAIPLNNR
jgi:hypothetical protein